ncbi:hypothetical protein AQUCO_01500056v1 [Aquilegia coerulea]|uniref:Uncharacterized protein n=1 Tax=Aquilegia coerulea TaxID=218851 RepID=A0A2G5DRX2_AQUCA|nr:hypothetical protein AQUCO_01500056v1 [Aquilegia coerulea]
MMIEESNGLCYFQSPFILVVWIWHWWAGGMLLGAWEDFGLSLQNFNSEVGCRNFYQNTSKALKVFFLLI